MSDLFNVSSVDADEFSVIVLTTNSDVDYAFAPLGDWLESTDQVEQFQDIGEQEQMLGIFMSYCMEFIDDDLMEESCPVITQAVFVGDSCIVIGIDVTEDVVEYITESYNDIEDVEAVVFGEAEDSEDGETDMEESDEEDEDDEFRL
jgi:hypothetical protein